MKLKLAVVDMELTKRQKRLVGGLVAAVVALGGAAVALAAVPKTFVGGETLTAADLNANFTALDGRATALEASTADLEGRLGSVEAAPTSITVAGTAAEVGTASNSPTIYSHADLVLPAGTWLVQGYAALMIAVNDDGVGLGLFDVTANADVPSSFGAIESLLVDAIKARWPPSAPTSSRP